MPRRFKFFWFQFENENEIISMSGLIQLLRKLVVSLKRFSMQFEITFFSIVITIITRLVSTRHCFSAIDSARQYSSGL